MGLAAVFRNRSRRRRLQQVALACSASRRKSRRDQRQRRRAGRRCRGAHLVTCDYRNDCGISPHGSYSAEGSGDTPLFVGRTATSPRRRPCQRDAPAAATCPEVRAEAARLSLREDFTFGVTDADQKVRSSRRRSRPSRPSARLFADAAEHAAAAYCRWCGCSIS